MKISITKEVTFDSAHRLTDLRGSKCQDLHGHTYRLQVSVTGDVRGTVPMIMDFVDLKKAIAAVVEKLDHKYLNDVFCCDNPTAEYMVDWIRQAVNKELPAGIVVSRVKLWETPTSFVELEV